MALSLSRVRFCFSAWAREEGLDLEEDGGAALLEQSLHGHVFHTLCASLSANLTESPQVALHIFRINTQEVELRDGC